MKKGPRGKKNRDAKPSDSPTPLPEVESVPTAHPSRSEAQQPHESKRPSFSDRVNVAIAGLTLIGVVIGAGVWRDSRESSRQAAHENRPIIVLERTPAALSLTPGAHLHHDLFLVNAGKTTAHQVRIRSSSMVCTCPEPETSAFKGPSTSGSLLTIPPRHRIGTVFDESLTETQVALLKTGHARFFALGEVHYRDESSQKHRARYCLVYRKDPATGTFQWNACSSNNFAE